MIRCYEDELIELAQIKDDKIHIDEINQSHKVGKVFSTNRLKMPFIMNYKFSKKFICRILLKLMPVFIVEIKSNKYACVGNFRCLEIARNANFGNIKIPVKIIINNDDLVRHMILIDTVVMPMLYIQRKSRKSIFEKIESLQSQIEDVQLTAGLKSLLATNNDSEDMCMKVDLFPVYKNNMKDILTIDCIRLLVEMYPIFVNVSNGKFVGNEFVFKICNESLPNRTDVPYHKIFRLNNGKTNTMSELSFLLPGSVYGLEVEGYSHLGAGIDKMSKYDKAWVFKRKITNKFLCNLINCSTKKLHELVLTIKKVNIKYENNEDLEKYNIKIDEGV